MSVYKLFAEEIANQNIPWNPVETAPKDGTTIIFLCGKSHAGEVQYDIGKWVNYKNHWAWSEGDLEGEWNTEFGNCDEILGWRLVD